MRIAASPAARELAGRHGSTLYVELRTPHCCTRSLTLLEVSTEPPADLDGYLSFAGDGLTVLVRTKGHRLPEVMSIDVVGKRRPKLRGYWDGCAYAV